MPLPAPRPPRQDDPVGSSGATPSWAARMAEADPAPPLPPAAAPQQQMPLFHADDLAPAPASMRKRGARLPGRIKALLTKQAAPDAAAPAGAGSRLPNSSWPDSFFDVNAGS